MYCIVWEYQVAKESESRFEEQYSRKGAWFKLFEPCDDFLGHDLLKNSDNSTYLVIDKWIGKAEYNAFIYSVKPLYDALNAESHSMYSEEKQLGAYETL